MQVAADRMYLGALIEVFRSEEENAKRHNLGLAGQLMFDARCPVCRGLKDLGLVTETAGMVAKDWWRG